MHSQHQDALYPGHHLSQAVSFGPLATLHMYATIEPVSAFSPANNPGRANETPSGGGDMEIQKAMLFYHLLLSNVCLLHR